MAAPRHPEGLTRRQRKAFTQRPGEDNYQFLARTHRQRRKITEPQLMMLRSNESNQLDAIRLYADLKMVQWTRALSFGTVVLAVCTVAAALIVRS